MANTGFKGVDIKQTGNQLVFRASLKDSTGAKVTSGTTTLQLAELQSDGTLKSYDFNDNTFKTTALTTGTLALTHRQMNNSTVNTGLWSAALSTLTGFTKGALYFAQITNSGATPTDQEREFQYGSAEGDMAVTDDGTGVGRVTGDVKMWTGTAVASPDTAGYPKVTHKTGTGAGEIDMTSGVPKANLAQILGTALTETAGLLAGGFKKFFNIASPTLTMAGVDQTGDSYARIGAPAGASVSADIAALLTAINNLNNLSALANLHGSPILEIPDSSSTLFPFIAVFRDEEGHLVDVDSNTVTLTATNAAGTDRSANLSSVTHEATGRYTFTYSVASNATEEGLRINAAANVGSSARYATYIGAVANYDSITTLAAIKAKTDNLPASPAAVGSAMTLTSAYDAAKTAAQAGDAMALTSGERTTLSASIWNALTSGMTTAGSIAKRIIDNLTGDIYARLGAPAGASTAADIAAVKTDTAAIKTKADNLPASPAAVSDIPTAAQNRGEMDANSTKLANLDVAVSTRAPAGDVTLIDDGFDYSAGALTGNGGWVTSPSDSPNSWTVASSGIIANSADVANKHATVWADISKPWTASVDFTLPTGGAGNDAAFFINAVQATPLNGVLQLTWDSASHILTVADQESVSGTVSLTAGSSHTASTSYSVDGVMTVSLDGVALASTTRTFDAVANADIVLYQEPATLGNGIKITSVSIVAVNAGLNAAEILQVAGQITTDHGAGSYVRNTEPDNASAAAAAASAATAAANTASLPSMIIGNQFTVSALSKAPSGGGGGETNNAEFKITEIKTGGA